MDFKEALEALEKMEGGADILNAIKTDRARLNAEAKANREAGEAVKRRLDDVLAAAGISGSDDPVAAVKQVKTTLDGFMAGGKKPEEVAAQIAQLSRNYEDVSAKLKEMTDRAETERARRVDAMKQTAAVNALTKGNAADPETLSRLIIDRLTFDDGENVVFDNNGQHVPVADGVAAWLNERPWAVRANVSAGSGAPAGGGSTGRDAFLEGLND